MRKRLRRILEQGQAQKTEEQLAKENLHNALHTMWLLLVKDIPDEDEGFDISSEWKNSADSLSHVINDFFEDIGIGVSGGGIQAKVKVSSDDQGSFSDAWNDPDIAYAPMSDWDEEDDESREHRHRAAHGGYEPPSAAEIAAGGGWGDVEDEWSEYHDPDLVQKDMINESSNKHFNRNAIKDFFRKYSY